MADALTEYFLKYLILILWLFFKKIYESLCKFYATFVT